jgi:GTP-binding protein
MALIDEVSIRVISGSGGNGCVSFRREKYIPRGGPDGGNGGSGGSVYLVATRDKTSLLDFKYRPKFEADRGEHGKGKDMFGRGAEDLLIQVPTGTQVYEECTGDLLCDLTGHHQKYLIAKGGKGGRGNLSFTSSTNRAPRTATPGDPGEIRELRLELRLLADVGLVGLPNAGKSSFLRAVSRATPKIADYPFTTLEPHLGVVDVKGQVFVVAYLPGLIEGASEGAGLGHLFLRHVSRNRLLLHLVDSSDPLEKIVSNIRILLNELKAYDSRLGKQERWLVFTKTDLLSADDLAAKQKELQVLGFRGFLVSSQTGAGMEPLLNLLAEQVPAWKKSQDQEEGLTAQGTESEDTFLPTVPGSECREWSRYSVALLIPFTRDICISLSKFFPTIQSINFTSYPLGKIPTKPKSLARQPKTGLRW